jgi:SAM-dependent methyltransferase
MTAGTAGERASLFPGSPQWGEHRSRYHYAAPFTAGKLVLDVACGTGFGAAILRSGGAGGVIGFDLSWDALAQCRAGDGMLFCRGDGTKLPIRDESFDAATSFETVEHIPDYAGFVRELHRVLRPGGVLVLSTPNALHTQPVDGVPRNPFHVREFTPAELRELLLESFDRVRIYGQRPAPAHRPCPYWEGPLAPRNWRSRLVATVWKAAARLPARIREPLWRAWRGVSFHPGEHDFVYAAEGVDVAHVLIAVCERA